MLYQRRKKHHKRRHWEWTIVNSFQGMLASRVSRISKYFWILLPVLNKSYVIFFFFTTMLCSLKLQSWYAAVICKTNITTFVQLNLMPLHAPLHLISRAPLIPRTVNNLRKLSSVWIHCNIWFNFYTTIFETVELYVEYIGFASKIEETMNTEYLEYC